MMLQQALSSDLVLSKDEVHVFQNAQGSQGHIIRLARCHTHNIEDRHVPAWQTQGVWMRLRAYLSGTGAVGLILLILAMSRSRSWESRVWVRRSLKWRTLRCRRCRRLRSRFGCRDIDPFSSSYSPSRWVGVFPALRFFCHLWSLIVPQCRAEGKKWRLSNKGPQASRWSGLLIGDGMLCNGLGDWMNYVGAQCLRGKCQGRVDGEQEMFK